MLCKSSVILYLSITVTILGGAQACGHGAGRPAADARGMAPWAAAGAAADRPDPVVPRRLLLPSRRHRSFRNSAAACGVARRRIAVAAAAAAAGGAPVTGHGTLDRRQVLLDRGQLCGCRVRMDGDRDACAVDRCRSAERLQVVTRALSGVVHSTV